MPFGISGETLVLKSAFLATAAIVTIGAAPAFAGESRGQYLARIMDCAGCHTPGALLGAPEMEKALSGGNVGFEVPGMGVFSPPNLTNHETGLAAWTEQDVVAAVTRGVRPDGRQLAPVMPWHAYSALTPEDALALARFLKSTAPTDNDLPDPVGPGERAPLPYLTVRIPD